MSLKDTLGTKLQSVIQECFIRGLYQSSNWAAEQLKGLDEEGEEEEQSNEEQSLIFAVGEQVYKKEISSVLLASSLLTIGQYQRCAHHLQALVKDADSCSNLALFLYCYALYLGGEKNRLQNSDEKPKKIQSRNKGKSKKVELGFVDLDEPPKNPYLKELYTALLPRYSEGKLDSYLLYIFAVIFRDYIDQYGRSFEEVSLMETKLQDSDLLFPHTIFMQSLAANPWNW